MYVATRTIQGSDIHCQSENTHLILWKRYNHTRVVV